MNDGGTRSPESVGTFIRAATDRDIPVLNAIERRAAERFAEIEWLAGMEPAPTRPDVFACARRASLLWIAEHTSPPREPLPVGFIALSVSGSSAHIEEVDVLPEYGRRGIGAALVRHAAAEVRRRGVAELTLTTFRDVPWNAPFYAVLGFEEIRPTDLPDELAERLNSFRKSGIPEWRRVAMRRRLD